MKPRGPMPFWAEDWLSSPVVMDMTSAEEGALIRLCAICWLDPNCALPGDHETLRRLSRLTKRQWDKGRVLASLIVHPDHDLENQMTHPKVYSERMRADGRRQKAAESGRIGANNRWGTHGDPMENEWRPHGDPIASQPQPQPQPKKTAARDPSAQEQVPPSPAVTPADEARQLEQQRTLPHPTDWTEGYQVAPPCPKCGRPLTLRRNGQTGALFYNHHPDVGMGCRFHCDAGEFQLIVDSVEGAEPKIRMPPDYPIEAEREVLRKFEEDCIRLGYRDHLKKKAE